MAESEHDVAADAAADLALDRIVRLAASIFDASIVSLSLHAEGRVWYTSTVGLEDARNLDKTSLCAHLKETAEPLFIADALADERFRTDPMVASKPKIGFYAGVPLETASGELIGSLSIADVKPRTGFDTVEMQKLQDLAALAVDHIGLRREGRLSRRVSDTASAVLAAMSHDIRTPMNGVLGMAEVLLTADDLSDRHRRRVDIIKRSGENLLSIVDYILELARIETEEKPPVSEAFDLEDILRDTLAKVMLSDDSRAIQLNVSGDHLPIIGDASRLKTLLYHFLESAVGFASEDDIEMDVNFRSMGEDQIRVRFDIRNTGIDGDKIGQIFAAVEQGGIHTLDGFSEAYLSPIVYKKLATALDCDLGIEHHAGVASALWLEIDMKPSPVPAAITDSPKTAMADGDSVEVKAIRDVLVAEDNPDMALLIEDLLDEAGYKTTIAHDGASVLKVLGEQPIDLVLMDGRMPDMSGFETTKLIRQLPDQRADIPIIALTAEAMAGDRERYLAAGMDDYIAKPVDPDALIGAIERCSNLQR